LDIQRFTPPSNGYGRADVSLNIKSSFGFYSMVDLAPETFREEGTCIWIPIIVSCAIIWWKNQLNRDIISIDIPLGSNFPELSAQLKIQLNSQFLMEAIILMCWTIWTARNDLIFKGVSIDLPGCRRVFFRELLLL